MDEMKWSKEVFRLDQVADKHDMPCVVKILEGIYSENEAETVSAGDIIKLDKHCRIPKVGANFVNKCSDSRGDRWRTINNEEIFVPLNYKGKVKVVIDITQYNSIEELAKNSPRFAELGKALTVEKDSGEKVTIKKGETIEVDRVIPGGQRGKHTVPDKLVIKYDKNGASMLFGVPFGTKGCFQSIQDEEEYTIKEVIERYQLPQIVHFLQSDLSTIYMDSLVDVAENMRSITDTLKLNHVVNQEVLIGHYKPLEEQAVVPGVTETTVSRTLVVLPLDTTEFVRELEVNVLEDATEEDYELLNLVRRPSATVDAVHEMFYIDFAKKPGIVRLDANDYDYVDPPDKAPAPGKAPVRAPVRAPDLPPGRAPGMAPDRAPVRAPDLPPGMAPDRAPDLPPGSAPGMSPDREPGIALDMAPDRPPCRPPKPRGASSETPRKALPPKPKPHVQTLSASIPPKHSPGDEENVGKKKKSVFPFRRAKEDKHKKIQIPISPIPPTVHPKADDDDYELDGYEDIDDLKLDLHCPIPSPYYKAKHAPPKSVEKPTGVVSPSVTRSKPQNSTQSFQTLSVEQLHARLKLCGMQHLAEVCKEESLDGAFVASIDEATFKTAPFNLSDFDKMKLNRIKGNWVPM